MHLRRGNLILVGMPGCGKTTLGRVLARSLGKTFVDADIELERRLGVTISTIFEIEGEETFRTREEETLARLVQRVDIVLATGGGAVLRAINRERLRLGGTVLYLHTSPETTYERTRHNKSRPLLKANDPLARARALYAQRDQLYRETADLIIESDQRKSGQVLAFLRARLNGAPPAGEISAEEGAGADRMLEDNTGNDSPGNDGTLNDGRLNDGTPNDSKPKDSTAKDGIMSDTSTIATAATDPPVGNIVAGATQ